MAEVHANLLSPVLSGRAGNAVFVHGADGRAYMRPYKTPRGPHSPAQQRRDEMAWAARAFRDSSPAEHAAWERYAAGLAGNDPRTGERVAPRAVNRFIALAAKLLQARPGVVTELLLQPLAGLNRKPIAQRYRTQTFVPVPAAPGACAAAVHFVNAQTGQSSDQVPLGVLRVG